MALLTIAPDDEALAERVAERCAEIASRAIAARGSASICLTGGSTPKRTYELIASNRWPIAWDRVHLYWTDERHVPPDDPDSNFGMAREALVLHIPIPAAQVHRIRGELPPDEAARLYEAELPARFDLLLLGVGSDAHIASIFPGSPASAEWSRRVAAVWAPHLNAYRVTLTPPALLDSDRIVVLVAGAGKAEAVAAAFQGLDDAAGFPVHLLRAAGDRVEWFIDRAAARDVPSPPA